MRMRLKGFTLIELLIVVAIIAILAAIAVPNLLEAQVRSKVSRVKGDMRSYATAIEAYAVDNSDYPPSISIDIPQPGDPCTLTLGPYCVYLVPLEEGLLPLSTPTSYVTDALFNEPFNGRQGWIMYRGWDVFDAGGPPPDRGVRQPIYTYVALPNVAESLLGIALPVIQALIASVTINGQPAIVTIEEAQRIIAQRWWLVSPGPDTFYAFDQYLNETGGDILSSAIGEIGACTLERFHGIYDPTNGTVSRGEIVRTTTGFFNDRR